MNESAKDAESMGREGSLCSISTESEVSVSLHEIGVA
jgi:hypothetical protein